MREFEVQKLNELQYLQLSKIVFPKLKTSKYSDSDIIRVCSIIYPKLTRIKSIYDGGKYTIESNKLDFCRNDDYDIVQLTYDVTCYYYNKWSIIIEWPENYLISEEDWRFLISLGLVKNNSTILENYYTL